MSHLVNFKEKIIMLNKIKSTGINMYVKAKQVLADKRGGDYVSFGVQMLIAVVVGGLLLYALYALFGDTVIPTLKSKIADMFNYNG